MKYKGKTKMLYPTENKEKIFPEGIIKKKKTRIKIVVSLLIIIFAVGGVAGAGFTQKMRDFKGHGPWPFIIDKITSELNLTDEQKAKMNLLKQEIKEKMESRKKEDKEGTSDFEDAFKKDKLDKQTLESIFKKHDADREEMRAFFEDELIKFHDILNSEQRIKAVEKMKEFKDKLKMHKPESQ